VVAHGDAALVTLAQRLRFQRAAVPQPAFEPGSFAGTMG
jgi:hypothetical protein